MLHVQSIGNIIANKNCISENNHDVDDEDNIDLKIDVNIDNAHDENDKTLNDLFIIDSINLMQADSNNDNKDINEDNNEINNENKNNDNNLFLHRRKTKNTKK